MIFEGLFRSRKKGPRILELELKDSQLTKKIFDLIVDIEAVLSDLKKAVEIDNDTAKYAKLAELENVLLRLSSKVEAIREDANLIMSIKTQNSDFIALNDDEYLRDKLENLDRISKSLDELIDLVSHRPSFEELKRYVIDYVSSRISLVIDALNNIIKDDKQLIFVYSRISDL